ncbi:MAG: phosphate ABC transporter substrate-binding protein [bacterium]|nr:phosphate ABC transporter substrate-binding protein [bacterium]
MKKIFLLICIIFILSCNSNSRKKTLVIAGSTSVQPFVEGLEEMYIRKNKTAEINIQGGGSSAGIQSAISGTANIGMSSRHLSLDEEKQLKIIPIAYDAVVVILNPRNKIDNISLEDIRKIFSRKILNWKELGGEDKEINAITREDGSGTRGAFQELVMKETPISNACMVQDSNGSVREIVKADPWSIAYISLGLVDKDVKAVKIDGILPDRAAVKEKKYNFMRPFLFVHTGELGKDAKDFVDFVLSNEGQNFLEKEGLIKVGTTP